MSLVLRHLHRKYRVSLTNASRVHCLSKVLLTLVVAQLTTRLCLPVWCQSSRLGRHLYLLCLGRRCGGPWGLPHPKVGIFAILGRESWPCIGPCQRLKVDVLRIDCSLLGSNLGSKRRRAAHSGAMLLYALVHWGILVPSFGRLATNVDGLSVC